MNSVGDLWCQQTASPTCDHGEGFARKLLTQMADELFDGSELSPKQTTPNSIAGIFPQGLWWRPGEFIIGNTRQEGVYWCKAREQS
jgi:hypothetical protein